MTVSSELMPELALWNNGKGIEPVDWLYCSEPRSDLAVAYSLLFWPRFVLFEDHVLREGFDHKNMRAWQQAKNSSRLMVEAAINTIHVDDLFDGEPWSDLLECRCVHIAQTLGSIHRLKLASDFPDRKFEVEVFDGTQNGDDISMSFWQV